MKIAINKCYGGFGLSFEALKWLYDRKAACVKAMSLKKYYGDEKRAQEDLKRWREYQETGQGGFLLCPFTEDEKSVYFLEDKYDKRTRGDSLLIECIETLGEKANGNHAKLKIVNVPDGTSFHIDEYDGIESIHEDHRSWG